MSSPFFIILILLLAAASFFIVYGIQMPGKSYREPFQPLGADEKVLAESLKRHVEILAGEIGERNVWHETSLDRASTYISSVWNEAGFDVKSQKFSVEGVEVGNLEAEILGTSLRQEIIVVGAHYDSVIGSPGANDNASGVSAMLELSRLLKEKRFRRTIRFVAFVNEEPPFYYSSKMGSFLYARRCKDRREKIVAMFSLETIGYYSDEKGSQHYPFPFGFFYPDKGNFVAFVGNVASASLVKKSIRIFRKHAKFPSEGAALPSLVPGVGWSDHWSFWKVGYPAIMVTDTAPYRYPHYHSALDLPDKVDAARMSRLVFGFAEVIQALAQA